MKPKTTLTDLASVLDLSAEERRRTAIIECGASYLAKIGGGWYAGTFSMQWYGWCFDGWADVGYQLVVTGTPGDRGSWRLLFRIEETYVATLAGEEKP